MNDDTIIQSEKGPVTIAELRKLCEVVEPGIVLFHEHPHANAKIFTALVEIVAELGKPFGNFAIVLDLTTAQTRPKPDMVEAIVRAVRTPGLVHWATVQSTSLAIRTIARFVLARFSGVDHLSMHTDRDEAIAAARAALAKFRSEQPGT